MWKIFLRPFPFLLSPVVSIHIIAGSGRGFTSSYFHISVDVVRNPVLFDAGSVFGYVRRFRVHAFYETRTWTNGVHAGLVALCVSTIFAVSYGFNTAQIVSPLTSVHVPLI